MTRLKIKYSRPMHTIAQMTMVIAFTPNPTALPPRPNFGITKPTNSRRSSTTA